MNELFAIAGSTWRNVLRLKVVYFLVFCVWVLVACALNYDVLSRGLEKELLIDASLMRGSGFCPMSPRACRSSSSARRAHASFSRMILSA